jgi:hypothetical protein
MDATIVRFLETLRQLRIVCDDMEYMFSSETLDFARYYQKRPARAFA